MAEVYWIHLPEHTDMFTQGYIGVTSKTAQERYKGHVAQALCKTTKKGYLHNVIKKYGKDSLAFSHELLTRIDEEISPKNLQVVTRVVRKFSNGWNPVEDPLWIEDFKGIPATGVYKFRAKWVKSNGKSKDYWTKVGELYQLYLSNIHAAEAGRLSGCGIDNAVKIYREYFKKGWIPTEDPRWLSWVEDYTRSDNAA